MRKNRFMHWQDNWSKPFPLTTSSGARSTVLVVGAGSPLTSRADLILISGIRVVSLVILYRHNQLWMVNCVVGGYMSVRR